MLVILVETLLLGIGGGCSEILFVCGDSIHQHLAACIRDYGLVFVTVCYYSIARDDENKCSSWQEEVYVIPT